MSRTRPGDRPLTDLDINDRSLGERQPQALAELREQCPMGFSTRYDGFWHVAEYEGCVEAARDKRFTTVEGLLIPETGSTVGIIPPKIEPPEHTIPDYRVAPNREVRWNSGGVSCGVIAFPSTFTPTEGR